MKVIEKENIYVMKFWFEHGGICLWGATEFTKQKYGYAIEHNKLPISKTTIEILDTLENEYTTFLDWDCPSNPSPWSNYQKLLFIQKSNKSHALLCAELGDDHIIINAVASCVL